LFSKQFAQREEDLPMTRVAYGTAHRDGSNRRVQQNAQDPVLTDEGPLLR
jgi:hypothetical protein